MKDNSGYSLQSMRDQIAWLDKAFGDRWPEWKGVPKREPTIDPAAPRQCVNCGVVREPSEFPPGSDLCKHCGLRGPRMIPAAPVCIPPKCFPSFTKAELEEAAALLGVDMLGAVR